MTAAVALIAFSKKLAASRSVITGWSFTGFTLIVITDVPTLLAWPARVLVSFSPASMTLTVTVRLPSVGWSVLLM